MDDSIRSDVVDERTRNESRGREEREEIQPGASDAEILVHLAVLSRVPTQMPLEVQTDHRTHGTQLGSDLALCLLNTLKECKTSVTGGWAAGPFTGRPSS